VSRFEDTGSPDVRESESPDERRRRQRSARLALLVVAAAGALALVPLVEDLRSSSATTEGTDAAGGPVTRAAPPPAAEEQDPDTPDVDPEQPWLRGLASQATALAVELEAGGQDVELTAPPSGARCPEDPGAMSSAVGVPLEVVGDRLSDYPDRCEWSPPGGSHGDTFSVAVYFSADWTAADLEDLGGDENCWRTPVEAFEPAAVLEACVLPGTSGSIWTLLMLDSSGTGLWSLSAVDVQDQPVDGPTALRAALGVATETW